MTPNKLPPLPEPSISFGAQSGLSGADAFTADQMLAYGKLCSAEAFQLYVDANEARIDAEKALLQSQSLPAGAVAWPLINYDVVSLFANDAEVEKVDFNWLIRCIRDCVTVNNGDADGAYYRWLRDEATKEQLDAFSVRRGTRLAADRLCANETDAERNAAKALNKPSPKSEAELPYDNAGDDLGPQQDRSNCAWPFCTGCDFPGTDCGPEKE